MILFARSGGVCRHGSGLNLGNCIFSHPCFLFLVSCFLFPLLSSPCSLSSAAADDTTTVLIPPKPGPFDDPAAPKKYKTTCYGDLYVEQVRALFGSSAMSIAMTCGLHYYKGMGEYTLLGFT